MLTYTLDISERSRWLRTTPGPTALAQPYYATEAGLFYAGSRFETARTSKNSYLVFYTLSGEGKLVREGNTLSLTPGTAYVFDCRQPQRYGTAPGASHWHHYWAHIDGSGVSSLTEAIHSEKTLPAVPVPDSVGELFEHLMSRIPLETADAVLSSSLDIHRILQYIASSGFRRQSESGRSHRELMEMSAEYIREHYAEELHIQTLLSLTHVSRSYFLRLFQKHMGTTPYNFLLRTRITRAKELLEMTDLPVSVIAARVGFQGETNFSARFSSIAGLTPGQYRKQAISSQKKEEHS